jgi:aconitate hydratase
MFETQYAGVFEGDSRWKSLPTPVGDIFDWDPKSTYVRKPPYFDGMTMQTTPVTDISGARVLALLGDSVTTDHISPAGSIKADSPAGKYLVEHNVARADFNSYGSRRGNHEIMMRGTFANVRIKNLMIPAKPDGSRIEGGITLHQPSGQEMSIYDAAMKYIKDDVPTMIFAGEEYGTGSSRDWAAKGTQLLGVKAVVARSFERIHRSNLVGMGVLPLQFLGNDSVQSLNITGKETFDLLGLENDIKPQQEVTLVIKRANGDTQRVKVLLRIDTPIEVDYYRHGGILPFVLRQLLAA